MDNSRPFNGSHSPKMNVFLLTKPPKSDRARVCLQLTAQSENAVLYLIGDGVYNLLDNALEALPRERIFACEEDLKARGVQPGVISTVPNDFYEMLIEDIMLDGNRAYTF